MYCQLRLFQKPIGKYLTIKVIIVPQDTMLAYTPQYYTLCSGFSADMLLTEMQTS